MRLRCFALVWLACLVAISSPVVAAEGDTAADEMALKSARLRTDGPGLLEFFRQRSQAQVSPERLVSLARQLADNAAAVRDQAAAELIAIGPAAIPLLRQAVKDPDEAATAALARRCLRALEGETGSAIPAAAARLLMQRQPDNAIPVLLAYLPFADNDTVVEEVKNTLAALAYRTGKADPALVRALEDELSIRRAIAIDALCAGGAAERLAEPRATLRKLLQDKKPIVRMRAALALANAREPEAVSALITLLEELPQNYGKQVEEYLTNLAEEQAPKAPLGNDVASRKKCSAAWGAWWRASDGPALVEAVRKRTLRDVDREKVLLLVQKLGDDEYSVREQAQADLKAMGTGVIALLRQAMNSRDVEISTRVNKLLADFEKDKGTPLSAVTLRLIAFRKPKGAAEALLAFLPLAEEGMMQDELEAALGAAAYADGKPEPAVLNALQDKNPRRRAAAVTALCQLGAPYPQAAVRQILQDADATVRLKAALALAGVLDKEAVPVLIASIGELPAEQSTPAEEYLQRLAGERAPAGALGSDDDARKKRRDAWAAWWKENGARVQLVAFSKKETRQRYYGYTLIVLNQTGTIMEIGADGKERWQLAGFMNPMDAQVLPGDRLLVAEYNANRVTERNLKNEILWQFTANLPVGCQRLANGNTLIVSRHEVVEVTRNGKKVFTLNRANFNDIMAARKLRDGQIVIVSAQNLCIRFDATGREVRSFAVQNAGQTHGSEVLANGNVLIPLPWQGNKICEYNPEGKVVWEATLQGGWAASRSPNGHTMVASQNWPPKVYELDKEGKIVWEHQIANPAIRVKRR